MESKFLPDSQLFSFYVITQCFENRAAAMISYPDDEGTLTPFYAKSQGNSLYIVNGCRDERDAMVTVGLKLAELMHSKRPGINWYELPLEAHRIDAGLSMETIQDHLHEGIPVEVMDNAHYIPDPDPQLR